MTTPEAALAAALDKHMAEFLEQPESFDSSGIVAANIGRLLHDAGWVLTPVAPDTIRALLDAHDRMAAALRRLLAMNDAWQAGPEHDAALRHAMQAAIREARAALAVPKEENPR